ncbi:helix-turn-helix transcriptional regulator [Mucilaginibacter sp.]|jgi:AraC-like DNA-binding protein|uniref:helix-turn-helix transcriptional regulator n=1 Tax=Mucilaginibacter sp. TaxID=1882438 RepID=UPI002C04AACE|nr:helix-turn-helix transcriptional regulator [Mucilaginibacter sp.]HTI61293.1 helix-turn-helix transcriptional regulator [Mucilaginibacter sp.]
MQKIPIRQLSQTQQLHPIAEKFKIRRIEDIIGEKDLVHHLHRHDFFFILSLKNGQGNHEVDFVPYKVQDHSIFFLRPGQVHQLFLKVGSTGYLLEFNYKFYNPKGTAANQRLRKASNKNFCEFDAGRFDKLQTALESMFQEYTAREEGFQEIIQSNLDIFCIEYTRQSPNPDGPAQAPAANTYVQERFEDFIELLDKHLTKFKQVSEYVDLMNLSPYQLNEITKSSVGKTASEVINEHIILEAKRYLLATPNQVKEIAEVLGYGDVSYFIRFFKKHTGLSPDVFRHNLSIT